MSDRIIGKYLGRTGEGNGEIAAKESDPDGTQDFGAFGILRGGQRERCIMLELRKKSGDILAIGYGWIERIEFIPSVITLHLPGQQIAIKGRNLNAEARPQVRLFQSLTRHRVCWIQEADQPLAMHTNDAKTKIERIEWQANV